ncbi:MAG: hypothetical protein IVW55_15205 [Chloroflexi bacterium]|nr:hypothetical protein [Chloroflexota bacterium]
MKGQIGFSTLIIASMLLVAGCGSSLTGQGPATSTQVAPTAVTAPTAGSSTGGNSQPSDASPSPALVESATAPVTEVPSTVAPISAPTDALATAAPSAMPTQPSETATAAIVPTVIQEATSSAPQGGSDDDLAAIFRMYQTQTAVKSFRYKASRATDAPGSSEVMEIVNPDRLRQVDIEGGKVTQEIIRIPGVTYSKTGGGAWQKTPVTAKVQAEIDSARQGLASIESFRKLISNVQALGTEDLDGMPTLVYQYEFRPRTTDTPEPNMRALNTKMWVAVSDGLPRKSVVYGTAKVNEQTRTSPPTTIIYYDYNADIKIEAPIP